MNEKGIKMYLKRLRIILGMTLAGVLCASSAAAQIKYQTPQAAARALYAAWQAKSKTRARAAADVRAVEKLFSTNFIARRKFAGCTAQSETEKGLYACVYSDSTDNLLDVAFETVKKGQSWRVRWVTFAAEN